MRLSAKSLSIAAFRRAIYSHYRKHKRDFPWRKTRDPYRILVSEFMLQQTQADRVRDKYALFLKRFPTVRALERASLREVLSAWQGLGYNRRALALHRAAHSIVERHRGRIPHEPELLDALPGVGAATAAAVAAFAFNHPSAFIETNIRSVFIHFFFPRRQRVRDSDLVPLIEASLDRKNPREWHYALMDYGAMLKRSAPNPSRRSAHHARQSPFSGSNREIRGLVVKLLSASGRLSLGQISRAISKPEERVAANLARLVTEGMVSQSGNFYRIAG